jgi:hypothetical protein
VVRDQDRKQAKLTEQFDHLRRLWRSRGIGRMISNTMPHAWKEREDLAKAEADITAGEKRVSEQILLIDELVRDGHDVTEAGELLQSFEDTLEQWRWHRQLILDEIRRQEGPDPEAPVP